MAEKYCMPGDGKELKLPRQLRGKPLTHLRRKGLLRYGSFSTGLGMYGI